ncbi:MAG: hypothetical protein ACHQHO_11415 [Solirubrobacterales bacterium]
MARILIVGGGCRGRRFSERIVERGYAVRATTRTEAGRAAIEATGAQCWIGTPDRLATLRGALEHVTVACWMLACARGSENELDALHRSRLEFFLSQAIDTTARGLVYDAWAVPARAGDSDEPAERRPSPELLAGGAGIFRSLTELNAIPAVVLARPEGASVADVGSGGDGGNGGDGHDQEDAAWIAAACDAVAGLLGGAR